MLIVRLFKEYTVCNTDTSPKVNIVIKQEAAAPYFGMNIMFNIMVDMVAIKANMFNNFISPFAVR